MEGASPAGAALPPASAHALYMERSDAGVVPSERCEQEHWEQAWTGSPVPVGTTHPMQLLRDSITAVEGGRPIDDVLVNTAMHLVMTEPHWRHAEPWQGEGLARVLFNLRETTSKMLLDGHLHWAPSEDEQEEDGDSGSQGGSASPGESPDSGRVAAESESDTSMADPDASEELNEMDEDAVVAMVRAADEQEGEIDEDARTHLSALELESLPSHTLAEPDGGAECSVCLAQMSGGQEVAPLACGHTFHRPCIVRWFARSCRCPYCRTPVPRASESGRGEPRGSRLEQGGDSLMQEDGPARDD